MGTHQTRIDKINWIMARVNIAEEKTIALDEEKLVGTFCIFHAARRQTCREILKSLEDAGKIVRIAGMILTPKQYKSDNSLVGKIKSRILRRKQ